MGAVFEEDVIAMMVTVAHDTITRFVAFRLFFIFTAFSRTYF